MPIAKSECRNELRLRSNEKCQPTLNRVRHGVSFQVQQLCHLQKGLDIDNHETALNCAFLFVQRNLGGKLSRYWKWQIHPSTPEPCCCQIPRRASWIRRGKSCASTIIRYGRKRRMCSGFDAIWCFSAPPSPHPGPLPSLRGSGEGEALASSARDGRAGGGAVLDAPGGGRQCGGQHAEPGVPRKALRATRFLERTLDVLPLRAPI
jgi:hypothetical protein